MASGCNRELRAIWGARQRGWWKIACKAVRRARFNAGAKDWDQVLPKEIVRWAYARLDKLAADGEYVFEYFDVHGRNMPPLIRRYNIAPTQPIAIIRTPHQLEFVRWGIKVPNPRAPGFNVRVESLGAPFYRESIAGRRCLILADGFYEWRRIGEIKKPYLIKRHDGAPFAFAGFWDKVSVKGELVDAATILTTTPRGAVAEIHDRMPVVLPPERFAKWLDPAARYRELLEPDAGELELVEVSTLVNSVKNDDPRCAEPVA